MDKADDIQMGQPKNPAAIIEAADRTGDDLPKMPGQSTKTITSRQDHHASLEIIGDDIQQYPFGQPKNTTATIEAADKNDEDLPKMPNQSKNTAKDRRASVEIIDDDTEFYQHPSGQPKNPTAILEVADGSDDEPPELGKKEETPAEELGECWKICYLLFLLTHVLAHLQKEWRSPIYAFFRPEVTINHVEGRCTHDFTCAATNCKGRGKDLRLVRHYLDMKDKASTGSLHAHATKCWGKEIVQSASVRATIGSEQVTSRNAAVRQ